MAYEWIPYAASAAASMIGAGVQNSGSASSQARAYNYQRQLMGYSNDLSMQNYKSMFDYEANYNSPANQMSRMVNAGINPYVAASSQGVGKSETAVGAPTAPSGAAPSMYTPVNVMGDIPQSIANLAVAFKNISETKGQDIDNEYQRDTLAKRIEALGVQVEGQQISNNIAKIQLICDSLYKIPQAKALLDKTEQEVVNLVTQKENYDADTGLKIIQQEYYDALGELTGVQRDLLEKQFPFLVQQVQETVKLTKQQQAESKAREREANASAENQTAQAGEHQANTQTINALREFYVEFERNKAKMSSNALEDYYAARPEIVHEMIENGRAAGYISELMYQQARNMEIHNNYKGLLDILGGVSYGVKAGK